MQRHGGNAAVLCLDLDGFKGVNDRFGHATGDALLREVAERLRAVVRTEDTVERMGGDEFVVLQVGSEQPEGATRLAQRIIDALGTTVRVDADLIRVGVSIGIAFAPDHGQDPEIVLKQADAALYAAKAEGKNTYRVSPFAGRVVRLSPKRQPLVWA